MTRPLPFLARSGSVLELWLALRPPPALLPVVQLPSSLLASASARPRPIQFGQSSTGEVASTGQMCNHSSSSIVYYRSRRFRLGEVGRYSLKSKSTRTHLMHGTHSSLAKACSAKGPPFGMYWPRREVRTQCSTWCVYLIVREHINVVVPLNLGRDVSADTRPFHLVVKYNPPPNLLFTDLVEQNLFLHGDHTKASRRKCYSKACSTTK